MFEMAWCRGKPVIELFLNRLQKKFVKLKTQRNARKRTSITKPTACSPFGPTRILEILACVIAYLFHELFKTILKTFTLAEYVNDYNLIRKIPDCELAILNALIADPLSISLRSGS